jgi:hypothetical protein
MIATVRQNLGIPDIRDVNRHIELGSPVRQGAAAVICDCDLRLKT